MSRSRGQSAVACAAYRSASKLLDNRINEVFDYSKKRDCLYSHTLFAGKEQPDWLSNREAFWNQAEASEKRKNSTVMREVECSLPHELSLKQNIKLASSFARSISKKHQVPVDINIHQPHRKNSDKNIHVHLTFPTRRLEDGEFTVKTREWDDRKKGKETVNYWREQWAVMCNKYLAKSGVQQTIDHRSYEKQGIDKLATQHLGQAANQMRISGRSNSIVELNNTIIKRNEAAYEHTTAIKAIEAHQRGFSQDITRMVKRIEARAAKGQYDSVSRLQTLLINKQQSISFDIEQIIGQIKQLGNQENPELERKKKELGAHQNQLNKLTQQKTKLNSNKLYFWQFIKKYQQYQELKNIQQKQQQLAKSNDYLISTIEQLERQEKAAKVKTQNQLEFLKELAEYKMSNIDILRHKNINFPDIARSQTSAVKKRPKSYQPNTYLSAPLIK